MVIRKWHLQHGQTTDIGSTIKAFCLLNSMRVLIYSERRSGSQTAPNAEVQPLQMLQPKCDNEKLRFLIAQLHNLVSFNAV